MTFHLVGSFLAVTFVLILLCYSTLFVYDVVWPFNNLRSSGNICFSFHFTLFYETAQLICINHLSSCISIIYFAPFYFLLNRCNTLRLKRTYSNDSDYHSGDCYIYIYIHIDLFITYSRTVVDTATIDLQDFDKSKE